MAVIIKSYVQYNKNIYEKCLNDAKSNLRYSTHLSIQTFNAQINSITSSLENIATTLSYTDLNYASDNLKSIEHKEGNNNIQKLEYIPLKQYDDLLIDSSIKKQMVMDTQIVYTNVSKTEIYITTPVKGPNTVKGWVRAIFDPSKITSLFMRSTFDGAGTAILMENDSTIYINNSVTNYLGRFTNFLKTTKVYAGSSVERFRFNLLAGESGDLHFDANGKEWYAYYSPTKVYNMYIMNIVPARVLMETTAKSVAQTSDIFNQLILITTIFIFFILIVQVINNKKIRTEQKNLYLEKERYRMVLNHSQGAVWEYDIATDTVTKSDPDLGIHTGISLIPEFKNFYIEEGVIHPDDIPNFKDFYSQLKSGKKEVQSQFRAKDISGKMIWFELIGTTIFDNNGIPISVIGQTVNIDLKKKELDELRNSATRDSLTKLYNRTTLIKKVNDYLSSSQEHMTHAFFMIDIDNFKAINDTYGHTFGDAVLLELSTKLFKFFKEPHIIARLGGDEFVAFLYNIPSTSYATEKAEKIISIFQKMFITSEDIHKISGSIGIAFYPEHGTTFDELLSKSDIALYNSKSLGKDCYSIYQKDMTDIITVPNAEQNHKVSRYQLQNRSIIDSSIIANTVNLLFDARDINSSINMILSVIGNYYSLDCLEIFEFSDDYTTASITYEWCSDAEKRFLKQIQQIPLSDLTNFMPYADSEEEVYYNNAINTNNIPEGPFQKKFIEFGPTSVFQCGIYENATNKGFVTAFYCDEKNSFNKPEISTLTLLAKIIGGYLLKLRAQEKIELIATTDPLTNAYNLIQFMVEAQKKLEQNPEKKYIIIYTDIDKFKLINETYGFSEGDHVLREFARNLKKITNENEIFARASGDKFVALFEYENKDSFLRRLEKFNTMVNSIPKTENDFYKLAIIIGLYPITETNNITLHIDRANIARKSITERHKTTYAFFDETMKSSLVKQKEIEDVMEDALKNEEFIVYYQPKFLLKNNSICGAEALVRWNRPGIGLVPPNEFIPTFEENGFIVDIDFYVLDKVCAHIRSLLDREMHVVPISVNFSRLHLKSQYIVSRLKNTIFHYDIPSSLIEIEITESALVDDSQYLLSILHNIRSAGFRLSMDDFGSGLSSLNMLRTMPFQVLKLDKNFFHGTTTTEREKVVITNVVKMANELDMEIISEGVETEEQAELLRSINCTIAQGFLYERPIPLEEYEKKYC